MMTYIESRVSYTNTNRLFLFPIVYPMLCRHYIRFNIRWKFDINVLSLFISFILRESDEIFYVYD